MGHSLHDETWSWVEGTVAAAAGDPLEGPVGGGPCVGYEIWGYRVLSGQQLDVRLSRFILERGAERFLVGVGDLTLERDKLPSASFWTAGRGRSASALTFLARRGLVGGPSEVMQVVEWTVPVGATVRLWGRTRLRVDPDGDDAAYRVPPRRPALHARKLVVLDAG